MSEEAMPTEVALRSALEARGWVASDTAPVVATPVAGRLLYTLTNGWAAVVAVTPQRAGKKNVLSARAALTYPKAERVMAALGQGQCNLQVPVETRFPSRSGDAIVDRGTPGASVEDFLTYIEDVVLPWCSGTASVPGWAAIWLRHDGYDENTPEPDDVPFYAAMLLAEGRQHDALGVLEQCRATSPAAFEPWDEEFEERVRAFVDQGAHAPEVWPAHAKRGDTSWQLPAFTDAVADGFMTELADEMRKKNRLERWKYTKDLVVRGAREVRGAPGPGATGSVPVEQVRWRSVELSDGVDDDLEGAYAAGRPLARQVGLDVCLAPEGDALRVKIRGRPVGSISRGAVPRDVAVDAPCLAAAKLTKKDAAPRFLLQVLFRSRIP